MKLFEYVKYQYDNKHKYWNLTRNLEKEKKIAVLATFILILCT